MPHPAPTALHPLLLALCTLLLAPCGPAQASPPSLHCTQAPRTQWLSEAQIREVFGAQRYVMHTLKVTQEGCYEFYAVDAQGQAVEAYLDAVTGQVRHRQAVRLPTTGQN